MLCQGHLDVVISLVFSLSDFFPPVDWSGWRRTLPPLPFFIAFALPLCLHPLSLSPPFFYDFLHAHSFERSLRVPVACWIETSPYPPFAPRSLGAFLNDSHLAFGSLSCRRWLFSDFSFLHLAFPRCSLRHFVSNFDPFTSPYVRPFLPRFTLTALPITCFFHPVSTSPFTVRLLFFESHLEAGGRHLGRKCPP